MSTVSVAKGAPRYRSTRAQDDEAVSFADALLKGLAADGGLFVPMHVPRLEPSGWQNAETLAELGVNVLGSWLGEEMSRADLEEIVHDALNFETPLVQLEDNLWVLELFHGPTLSFKDYGARTMARLMQHFLRERDERRTILVATSGDTGSAVADGFAGQDNIDVVLLYPKGKVSEVQERQLITQRPKVRSFAVTGDFDACQRMVKAAFVDPELSHLPLSSANSINIGRLLPQSLYYLWAAARSGAKNVCVPSGNLGNLTGGVLATLAAAEFEVERFVAAHNANHFFPDFLANKTEAYNFDPTIHTVSNAMDVGSPSNFERLHALLGTERSREWIWGTSVDDAATLARMRASYERFDYIACPHTAVGLEGVARYRQKTQDTGAFISLACAHPAKFPAAVREALGIQPPKEEALESLTAQPTRVTRLEPTLDAFRAELLAI